ncbi:phage virion morphogenesis protein [Candidatus Borreliella tachyglossi]|uniref:phage virion morphogenesis protein n=1 Tax=Candidatus Borreliella tachyglossi TaxID=1964448 RepID=UPI004042615D
MLILKGLRQLKKRLAKFTRVMVNDMNPLGNYDILSEMGRELVKVSHGCFNNECAPDGRAWEALKPSTLRKRGYARGQGRRLGSLRVSSGKVMGGSSKILFIDGKLKESVTYSISSKSLVVGSPLRFAKLHMTGDRRKNTPKRPFLGINADFKHKSRLIIKKFGKGFTYQ